MKKSYLLGMFALAALTMVGCSNDEVVNDYSPENAIQFGTYVGRDAESRATVITDDNLKTEGFGVFAYYTNESDFVATGEEPSTPNFMYNQEVKVESGNTEYSYSPLKYWPNETTDKLSFFAYAPYKGTGDTENNLILSASTVGGVPTVDFTLNTTVKSQEDLLWATPHMNLTKIAANADINDRVKFEFKHALSRIGFAAEVMVDKVNSDKTGDNDTDTENTNENVALHENTTITINSVKIHGRFTDGILSLANGSWTIGADDKPTEAKTLELNTANTNFEKDANVFKSTDKKNLRDLNAADSYIMIVPQDFTDVENNGAIQIEVNYTVETTDTALEGEKSTIHNNILSDAFIINFEQGKAYRFVLHLGMTSVKLSATVAGWDDPQSDIVVNVPLNIADDDVTTP